MTGALRWLGPATAGPIVVAVPQAGSDAHYFQPLQDALAEDATVLSVQLPGRADRWRDEFPGELGPLLAALADELATALAGRPVLLLGCSFGGLLCYELVRRFPQLPVTSLVITSCRAPRWWLELSITEPERDLLLADIRRATAGLELDAESQRFLERPLLADIELARTLPAEAGVDRVAVPILALRGSADPLISDVQLAGWRERTTAGLRQLELPAGHDLVGEAVDQLAEAVRVELLASTA